MDINLTTIVPMPMEEVQMRADNKSAPLKDAVKAKLREIGLQDKVDLKQFAHQNQGLSDAKTNLYQRRAIRRCVSELLDELGLIHLEDKGIIMHRVTYERGMKE